MAASHRAAAAFLMIMSLLVAVALSGAEARPAVRPDKTVASDDDNVSPTGGNTKLTIPQPHDSDSPAGYVAGVAAADDQLVKPECGDEDDDEDKHKKHHKHKKHKHHHDKDDGDSGHHDHGDEDSEHQDHGSEQSPSGAPHKSEQSSLSGEPPYPSTESEESALGQELCSDCEEPKKPAPAPEPPCSTCEPEPKPEPKLTCNKVHAVQEGETCYSVGQCAGLGQDDFLRFNPNICCDHLFIGQWVCLDATCAD